MTNTPWNKVERVDGTDSNVSKFVFTSDNAVAETVLYKYPTYKDRTVVCFSVMSGCPMGCRFCGTGDFFVKNLSVDEIVAQVDHVLATTGVQPTEYHRLQLMSMSMGEPMLNQRGLEGALRVLHKKYPTAALLVSTSAPAVDYNWFRELSQEISNIGLQFSVHESTNEARNKLIPFKKKLTLEEIAAQGVSWSKATGRQAFFNYCANENNTSQEDADRLATLFDPQHWQSRL